MFSKNAQVGVEVAITSAKYFAQHARIKNSDLQAPLHLEKLSAHCNAERRRIYWEGNVFCTIILLKSMNTHRL